LQHLGIRVGQDMPARQPAKFKFRADHFRRGCERTLFASSCRIIGAVCSSDAAPRRIGRNHSRRFCHLIMARLAGGRRPERYQGVTTVKKKGIRIDDPRCQLVIVNARPSDLRCQKHQLQSITRAVDGPTNRVLCRSIPYFLGPGRRSRLKIFFLYPARAELIRLGKISPLRLFPPLSARLTAGRPQPTMLLARM
jgi:hypothetical protein